MMLQSPCTVADKTITLNGSGQTALAANPYRTFLMLQAPNGSAVTFSFTNATPAAGATGCITLAAAGAPIQIGPCVPNGPLYVIGTNAAVFAILEGSVN
jgi:hypothetical protein